MRRPVRFAPGDAASLSAWVAEARAAVNDLYNMVLDGTAKKRERRQAKVYLRNQARRRYLLLESLLTAVDPALLAASPEAPPSDESSAAPAPSTLEAEP